MDRDTVMAWVAGYERAWRDGDLEGVEALFTPDARYRVSPYATSLVGHAGIKKIWLSDEGETFTVAAEIVALDGPTAVLRLVVRYGEPLRQEYTDLWLVRFAADGRAEDFEEWPYWPKRRYSASTD
ncbi:MAG: nuclear transport factor 2 family protein [Propionibacteriaceae bacterium]